MMGNMFADTVAGEACKLTKPDLNCVKSGKKSNMLGFMEGMIDGVRARMVDHYNSQHVLCKELSLAPMWVKALRNGCPQTFHVQFHQLAKTSDSGQQSSVLPIMGDSFGLLPWKVAMLLLPC